MTAAIPWMDEANAALLTDLYELTMMQAYFREGLFEPATFDLFFRKLPENRNYLVAAGLETALAYLERLRFSEQSLAYLDSLGLFASDFLDYLRDFRFTGEVRAVPEGLPVFANEPVLEVIAPLPEAQLVETFLLNQLHFQTLMASKASRVVDAAGGRKLMDFGARRMHGTEASLQAARAFYLSGMDATSNVRAGQAYGIPVAGTMAHSYIEAHSQERAAFEAFATIYPETILLVDTYDTLRGVERVVAMAQDWGQRFRIQGIRLDSGELGDLAKRSRQILDQAGLTGTEIFASGSLDEYAISDLLAQGTPIDGFGVGTHLGVSEDSPYLDSAYKLVEYAGEPRMKLSTRKVTLPGRKQIVRFSAEDGTYRGDLIQREDEPIGTGEALLIPVMEAGNPLPEASSTLTEARERSQRARECLPPAIRSLRPAPSPYPVSVSEALQRSAEQLRQSLEA